MNNVFAARYTARVEKPIVLFLIGALCQRCDIPPGESGPHVKRKDHSLRPRFEWRCDSGAGQRRG